jgi:peptidyl-prolyl cis-trans isomerase A (cyclophilin A)
MRILTLIIIAAVLSGCSSSPKHTNPHVVIETGEGDIEIELYPGQAPKSVAAFLTYIKRGYYKRSSFYRVLNDDNQPSNAPKAALIQGGTYRSQPKLNDTLPGIPHESTDQTKILHTDGAISLARTAPGTATTEFFICIGDQPGFDFGGENNADKQGYAAFGKVVKGMDVVRSIYHMRENDQYFDPPVDIYNIKIDD